MARQAMEIIMKKTGDRFEIFKIGRRWHWYLEGGNFPTGPIARCRKEGYPSKQAAISSIQSARSAAIGASGNPIILDHAPSSAN